MFRLIVSYVTIQGAVQIILPKKSHDETVMQFRAMCAGRKSIFFSHLKKCCKQKWRATSSQKLSNIIVSYQKNSDYAQLSFTVDIAWGYGSPSPRNYFSITYELEVCFLHICVICIQIPVFFDNNTFLKSFVYLSVLYTIALGCP